ncbi:MAG: hypothetical protein E7509_06930 [Ruminococcus sp.]|nr:hypothetical protein [Ruminococcus sp.]
MLEIILHICEHSLLDTLKIIPFLFAVFLFIEFVEHKGSDKLGKALTKLGPFGAVGGALLGCVPQCGFSVMAANLFSGRLISMGTLVAVFISTSDEAIPVMISQPDMIPSLWKLLLCKVIIAVIAGIAVDVAIKIFFKSNEEEKPFEELCSHCGCGHHSIWYSAILHTLSTALFILAVNVILSSAIEIIGESSLQKVLMTDSFLQPLGAALFGFIPNCAASVILTQLYVDGMLSFGSVVAGLCTGAGVGIIVLFKSNKKISQNLIILGILYVIAVLSGLVINFIV